MTRPGEAPTPGLAHAFDMEVERGKPVEVGQLAIGGRRSHIPVIGGRFTGEGMTGRLVADRKSVV